MKKPSVFLFILRLFFYLSVTGLIVFHPGISVSFDRIGLLQWFVIIPLEAVIAFLPEKVIKLKRKLITALVFLFLMSVMAGGFGPGAFQPFIAGFLSFTLTFLLFQYPEWGKLSILEPFFLAWVCLRLLALSRSGEDIAGESAALTQFILVWTAVVFLLHSAVIYFCLYPKSSRGAKKEGALFFAGALAALLLVLVALPADFVRNTIINNMLSERIPEEIKSDSDRGIPKDASGRRRNRTGKDGQKLRGVSENDWPTRRGRGGGKSDNRQYMVMVVASEYEPVYMGDTFRGRLDPVEGFLVSFDEPLNQVASQRLFVTWYDNEWNFDMDREFKEVVSLSTLPQKYLPYRPYSIDPTILSEDSGPLRYIHQVVSNVNTEDSLKLVHQPSRRFSDFEKRVLAPYFEINLEEDDQKAFNEYLNGALENWKNNREIYIQANPYLSYIFSDEPETEAEAKNEYLEKILAILVSFTEFQYNLNDSIDADIDELIEFLFTLKEGDCVYFSNSLALLGRLCGIPSRVVTGYFAAENQQTPAHLQGLAALQRQIPFLQQFRFDDLYMVTNLHAHSWTQFYIPGYGWLDFEGTSFAIPPVGSGDYNTWDVVIPLFDDNKVFSNVRKFPWRMVLKTAGFLAAFALVFAYALRYGRELFLHYGAHKGGRAGARSLYLLLLARLAADGKPIKPASKTAIEYSELFPGYGDNGAQNDSPFKAFASVYSELRWREFNDAAQSDEKFQMLKQEYSNILNLTRQKGIHRFVIRIFSLRGLSYL